MSIYNDIIAGLNEAVEYKTGVRKARSSKWIVQEMPNFSAEDIRRLRTDSGYTQGTFASLLGVSVKAVEAWECGRNTPDGPTRRLIGLMQNDTRFFEKYGVVVHENVNEPSFIQNPSAVTTTSSHSRMQSIVLEMAQSEKTVELSDYILCGT